MIYLDTSVVAPFYWTEPLSELVDELISGETELGLSRLVEVELLSALSRRVRMGEISPEAARLIVNKFETHVSNNFYQLISIESVHYRLAYNWISQFKTPLRTLDALHLACADSNNIRLATADKALANSANILGIDIHLLTLDV